MNRPASTAFFFTAALFTATACTGEMDDTSVEATADELTVAEKRAFDDDACGGPLLTRSDAQGLFSGARTVLGTGKVVGRRRECKNGRCEGWKASGTRLRADNPRATKVEVKNVELALTGTEARLGYEIVSDVKPGFTVSADLPATAKGDAPTARVRGSVWLDPPAGPNIVAARSTTARVTQSCAQLKTSSVAYFPGDRTRYIEVEAAAIIDFEPSKGAAAP